MTSSIKVGDASEPQSSAGGFITGNKSTYDWSEDVIRHSDVDVGHTVPGW